MLLIYQTFCGCETYNQIVNFHLGPRFYCISFYSALIRSENVKACCFQTIARNEFTGLPKKIIFSDIVWNAKENENIGQLLTFHCSIFWSHGKFSCGFVRGLYPVFPLIWNEAWEKIQSSSDKRFRKEFPGKHEKSLISLKFTSHFRNEAARETWGLVQLYRSLVVLWS